MAQLAMLGPMLAGGGGTLAAVSTGLTALGTLKAGADAKASYKYQSQVQEQKADEAKSAGQRAAAAQYRQGRIVRSRQTAAAAASGGANDQSVLNIMGMTQKEVDLAARTEMFKAEQQAKGYRDAANVSRVNAKNAMMNGILGAAGDIAGGASKMYDRFNTKQQYKITSYG